MERGHGETVVYRLELQQCRISPKTAGPQVLARGVQGQGGMVVGVPQAQVLEGKVVMGEVTGIVRGTWAQRVFPPEETAERAVLL